MAAASTTNNVEDSCMMGENDVTNSVVLKHPTMAQVTMSQKNAKEKLLFGTKRPPFCPGFKAMKSTNRDHDYPVDDMELISDLIKKKKWKLMK